MSVLDSLFKRKPSQNTQKSEADKVGVVENTTSKPEENFPVSRDNGNTFVVQKEYGTTIIREKKRTLDNSAFILSDADIVKLLTACDRLEDRTMIELMLYSGLRRDEVAHLSARDVDFERGVLHLKKTKGLRERDVPLLPQTLEHLKFVLQKRREGWLFVNPSGNRLSIRSVNDIVTKAGKKAGLKHPAAQERGIHPHLLRHTFARRYLRNGGRMEVLQKLLGHSSITTTIQVYGSPSMENIIADYTKTVKQAEEART